MTKINITIEHPLAKHINKIKKIQLEIEKISIGKQYKPGLNSLNSAYRFFLDKVLKDNWDKPIKSPDIITKKAMFPELKKEPEIDKKSW
jgi:hypothetical protein